MRPTTTSEHKISNPSVPLSLYREVAAELQAKEAMLDSLKAQNQHLTQQNQQLQQEVEKAVQAVLRLQQIVQATSNNHPHFRSEVNRQASKSNWHLTKLPRSSRQHSSKARSATPVRSPFLKKGVDSVFGNKVFVEQHSGRSRPRRKQEIAKRVNGWWLAIAILLIVATAFAAGYVIVRPLLPNL